MPSAVAAIAEQADLSVLIEGFPPQITYNPPTPDQKISAQAALTAVAEAYDYDWTESRSGFIFLRKRFSDESSRPETPEAELKATARDLVSITGRLGGLGETVPKSYQLLQSIEASLPPDAARQLSGTGVPVSSLPRDLAARVVQAANVKTFGPLAYQWSRLEAQLMELPEAVVVLNPRRADNQLHTRPLELVYPHSRSQHTRYPVALWRTSNLGGILPRNIPPTRPVRAAGSSLLQAYSVGEAARLLRRELKVEIQIAPELLQRRLGMLIQKKDASRTPAALAELHGWAYEVRKKATASETSGGRVATLLLGRRRPQVQQVNGGMGIASLASLPLDVARCLTTAPVSSGGKRIAYVRDAVPLPGPNSQEMGLLSAKMSIQEQQAKDELRQLLADRDFTSPVPVTDLTEDQRRVLVYALFAAAGAESVDPLMRTLHGLPSYLQDPLNSTLIRRGNSYGLRGPRGGGFMLQPTRPGS